MSDYKLIREEKEKASDKYRVCGECNKFTPPSYGAPAECYLHAHKLNAFDKARGSFTEKPCKCIGCYLTPPCPDCGRSIVEFNP